MSDQEQIESESSNAATVEQEAANDKTLPAGDDNHSRDESTPEFQDLGSRNAASPAKFELQRFGGVQVVLTAELGRIQVTIHDLMGLSEGSILELNREISAPVELVAQGVPLGNGEVVVVDDRFAVRIKQIYQV